MEVVEQQVEQRTESIATPIKVVLVGAVLALIEGAYDLFNAELYAGVVDGVEVTTGDIILFTAIAMVFGLGMLAYAYTVRFTPTQRNYLVLGLLSVLTLVIGVLFTVIIALLGAAIGFWETRRSLPSRPVGRFRVN